MPDETENQFTQHSNRYDGMQEVIQEESREEDEGPTNYYHYDGGQNELIRPSDLSVNGQM